jgi:hypothetical protein
MPRFQKQPQVELPPPTPEQIGTLTVGNDEYTLLRVPPQVFAAWRGCTGVVGEVELVPQGNKAPLQVVRLNDAASGGGAKEYELESQEVQGQWHVLRGFQPDDTNVQAQSKWHLAGPIRRKLHMRPQLSKAYMDYAKQKRVTAEVPQYNITAVERVIDRGPKVFHHELEEKIDAERAKDRRERMDRDLLLELLHKAFRRREFWTLRELVQETDQPLTFLREVIEEIAEYNTRGENKGTYQIKASLRHDQ